MGLIKAIKSLFTIKPPHKKGSSPEKEPDGEWILLDGERAGAWIRWMSNDEKKVFLNRIECFPDSAGKYWKEALIGWRNFIDNTGKEIPFSKNMAEYVYSLDRGPFELIEGKIRDSIKNGALKRQKADTSQSSTFEQDIPRDEPSQYDIEILMQNKAIFEQFISEYEYSPPDDGFPVYRKSTKKLKDGIVFRFLPEEMKIVNLVDGDRDRYMPIGSSKDQAVDDIFFLNKFIKQMAEISGFDLEEMDYPGMVWDVPKDRTGFFIYVWFDEETKTGRIPKYTEILRFMHSSHKFSSNFELHGKRCCFGEINYQNGEPGKARIICWHDSNIIVGHCKLVKGKLTLWKIQKDGFVFWKA